MGFGVNIRMNPLPVRTHRPFRHLGFADAVIGASLSGFAVAALLLVGPGRLRETQPIASLRRITSGEHGTDAEAPTQITPSGLLEVTKRTAMFAIRNRLMAEAAAITFYALLALFPGLAATVSVYGLFADPDAIQKLVDALSGVVPGYGLSILHDQLTQLIKNGPRGLSLGVAIGLAAALWSSNQGSKALFETLNVVYGEREKRSYGRFVLIAMASRSPPSSSSWRRA